MSAAFKFDSIQYLRALAAVAVVAHHSLHGVSRNFLAAGVDLFFVISGFIMYSVGSREAVRTFLKRRIVRVVPLYWFATLLVATISVGLHPDKAGPQFGQELMLSLLFVPHYSLFNPTVIEPLLWLGWTLNYEMFFYALFAVGMATGRLLPCITLSLCGLVLAGLLRGSASPLWITYTDPLLLEFLAGIYLGRFADRLGRWSVALLPIGLAGFWIFGLSDAPRILAWGVPALAVVAGALSIERLGRLPEIRWLKHWGDASYSIYLFQGFGLFIGAAIPAPAALSVFLRALFGVIAGLVAHAIVEMPLLNAFRNKRAKERSQSFDDDLGAQLPKQ